MNAYRSKTETFFGKEYNRLKNYIHNHFSNLEEPDAEDAIQDVALAIFNKIDFDTPVKNITAYLFRALRNKVIDFYRKQKDSVPISFYEEEDENMLLKTTTSDDFLTEDEFEKVEFMEAYDAALKLLPPNLKAVWVATEIEEVTFERLSKEWGIPIGTLLARKHRAKARLQQILAEYK